jgi:lipopolysaccharide biosynthesis protein
MPDPLIAVFVHVHYPEIWEEMRARVAERLTLPFRLVLTSARAPEEIALPETPHMVSARFVPVANRGRDIRPFLAALAETPDFDIGLKLHTKKSPQREDGAAWRNDVLDSLLPPPPGVADIVARLGADPRIGLVAPAGFALSVRPWVLVNADGMARVMSAVGHELADDDLDDAFFAAGSMFWFRRCALSALASAPVLDLFEPEEGQLDGTIAHAMERIFPVEARRRGLASLALPALTASSPAMPTAELIALARQHADIPSTYFPAPYVAALPRDASPEQLARALASPAAGSSALPAAPPRGIAPILQQAYARVPAMLKKLYRQLRRLVRA